MLKHGEATRLNRSSIYDTWINMKQRCLNPDHPSYVNYGARGIRVCVKWIKSFAAFRDDMGPRPPGYTLERKSNNKGYTPSNCVWASRSDQQVNRRNNINLTYKGRTMALKVWADEVGINHVTLRQRVVVLGWSTAEALTTPPGPFANGRAKRRIFSGPTERR